MSEDRPRRPGLGADEIARYARHLTLPEVGMEGQLRLRESSVLVVGVGGLGSPAALYLAAAGVGRLGLVDPDHVDASNLQRQVLYGTGDVGRPKLDAARERLTRANPFLRLDCHAVRLAPENARTLIEGYDVVLDGADNFPARYAVNDACAALRKPEIHGSVFRFEGQASVFWAGHGPCYRCLYPDPPPADSVPDCAEGGVLGVLPGVVGAIQAAEAIKIILGIGSSLVSRLLLFNALEMRFREIALRADPSCPTCGDRPSRPAPQGPPVRCVQPPPPGERLEPAKISPVELRRRLDTDRPPFLLDVRTPVEWEICRLPGARLLPLHELAGRIEELDRRAEIVVYCHVGIRSALAVRILERHGFKRTRNLTGGILAWAHDVDPELPRY